MFHKHQGEVWYFTEGVGRAGVAPREERKQSLVFPAPESYMIKALGEACLCSSGVGWWQNKAPTGAMPPAKNAPANTLTFLKDRARQKGRVQKVGFGGRKKNRAIAVSPPTPFEMICKRKCNEPQEAGQWATFIARHVSNRPSFSHADADLTEPQASQRKLHTYN